jgi:hypothetical protein
MGGRLGDISLNQLSSPHGQCTQTTPLDRALTTHSPTGVGGTAKTDAITGPTAKVTDANTLLPELPWGNLSL